MYRKFVSQFKERIKQLILQRFHLLEDRPIRIHHKFKYETNVKRFELSEIDCSSNYAMETINEIVQLSYQKNENRFDLHVVCDVVEGKIFQI